MMSDESDHFQPLLSDELLSDDFSQELQRRNLFFNEEIESELEQNEEECMELVS